MNLFLTELVFKILLLLPLLLAGIFLGAIFFGGLWWTIQKMQTVKYPGLLFLVSFLLRLLIVLTGIYWLGSGDLLKIGVCILGFLLARYVIIQLTRLEKMPYAS